MPSRNTLKFYSADSYYHVYNRGVNKRLIFLDDEDYLFLIQCLKWQFNSTNPNNLSEDVSLVAYCLMPNHFHILVKQLSERGLERLMRSLMTRYVSYFNRKYRRIGPLFQGRYKAVLISSDEQLVHTCRYIHLNPSDYATYAYSNYQSFVQPSASWENTSPILEYFNDSEGYRLFVATYATGSDVVLERLAL